MTKNQSELYDNKTFYSLRKLDIFSLSPSIWSSIIMAIGGMGDALLYVYLPIKGDYLGMSLISVGFLLSVNKFSRFFTNRWVAYLSQQIGIKKIMFLGAIFAAITTYLYAFNPVIWIWIILRIIWGFAYSAMRFSTIQYAGISTKTGSALGLGRSIQEIGPLLAYWIGPIMINEFGAETTFISWSISILALLPIFFVLPNIKPIEQRIKWLIIRLPNTLDIWIFISSFAIEGLLIVGMSRLIDFNTSNSEKIMIISALYISFRRLMNIIISPISGWMSDNFSFKKVFHTSCILIILGLFLIAAEFPKSGIIVAFIGSAINLTLMPIIAFRFNPMDKNFDSITGMTTSRDIGSALGALIALHIFSFLNTSLPFLILGMILIFYWSKIRNLDKSYE